MLFRALTAFFIALGLLATSAATTAQAAAKSASSGDSSPGGTSDFQSYNLRIAPLSLVLGSIVGAVDFRIGSQWSIGPQFTYAHASLADSGSLTNTSYSAIEAGARANWFANGVFRDGLYVGPSVSYLNVQVNAQDTYGSLTGTGTGFLATCVVGYGWFWDNVNIMLGGGYQASLGGATIAVTDSRGYSYSETVPLSGLAIDFTLGYAF
jgi:hypothetical protein